MSEIDAQMEELRRLTKGNDRLILVAGCLTAVSLLMLATLVLLQALK